MVRDQFGTVKVAGWIVPNQSKTKKTGKKKVVWFAGAQNCCFLLFFFLPLPPPPPLYTPFNLVRKSLRSQWWTGGFGFAIQNPAEMAWKSLES